jgi:hypothetical protein
MSPDTGSGIAALESARREVMSGVISLLSAGNAIAGGSGASAARDACRYAEQVLVPYLGASQYTLYTAVNGVLGSPQATDVMCAQQRAIEAMVSDLGKVVAAAEERPIDELRQPLLALLYGLYAFARGHLESEEDVFLPLLQSYMSESQLDVLAENLGRLTQQKAPASE